MRRERLGSELDRYEGHGDDQSQNGGQTLGRSREEVETVLGAWGVARVDRDDFQNRAEKEQSHKGNADEQGKPEFEVGFKPREHSFGLDFQVVKKFLKHN